MNKYNYKKLICLSDCHFGARANSMDVFEMQKQYYYEWFIPLLKKITAEEIDVAVFVCGDVFDNKMNVSIKVLNLALDIFNEITKIAPVHIIIGNHDIFTKNDNSINSLKPIGLLNNVTIYEEPKILNINKQKIYMMPWRINLEEERKSLEEASINKCNYVFCHTEVQGLQYNRFTNCLSGNTTDAYNGFTKIISGHIHYRQEVKNILMLGCPYHLTKGDRGNQKGIYILDMITGNFEFIENMFSPRYLKFRLDDILEWDVATYERKIKNNYIEIEYDSSYANFPFTKLVDDILGYKTLEYYVIEQTENNIDLIDENIDIGDYADLRKINIISLSDDYINNLLATKENKNRLKIKIDDLFNNSLISFKEEL